MGEKTLNEYFYKPSYGAKGEIEKGKFDDALDGADVEIKANRDARHEHSNKTELDKLTDGDHDVRTDNPHSVTKSQVSLSNVENLKVKLDGTVAPGVDNDNTEGYAVGSRWVDVTLDKEYVCLDASTGAAVWTETTGAGGGGSTLLALTDTPANYTNKENKIVKVNVAANAIEFVNYHRITTKTTTATLLVAEQGLILVSASAPYTITLPTAVGNAGLTYHFIKTDCNYNLITLDGNGAETFNYENATGAPVLTYARLNTYCAEVTIVSDGSNWQVIDEALGQVPSCWVYLSALQLNFTNATALRIDLDAEDFDIGSNFDNSTWVSGNATSTSAGHLVDTGGAFTAAMVNKRVKNTTDTTYTYVTAYNSPTDLTVRDDIFVNEDGYEIKHAKFVVPIPGKYFISYAAMTEDNSVVINKRYIGLLRKNGVSIMQANIVPPIVLSMDAAKSFSAALTTDDELELFFYAASAVDTCDVYGSANQHTFMQVKLISKD